MGKPEEFSISHLSLNSQKIVGRHTLLNRRVVNTEKVKQQIKTSTQNGVVETKSSKSTSILFFAA